MVIQFLSIFCELKPIPRELFSMTSDAHRGLFRPAESLLQDTLCLLWFRL